MSSTRHHLCEEMMRVNSGRHQGYRALDYEWEIKRTAGSAISKEWLIVDGLQKRGSLTHRKQ